MARPFVSNAGEALEIGRDLATLSPTAQKEQQRFYIKQILHLKIIVTESSPSDNGWGCHPPFVPLPPLVRSFFGSNAFPFLLERKSLRSKLVLFSYYLHQGLTTSEDKIKTN